MATLSDRIRRLQKERARLEGALLLMKGPLLKGSLFMQWVVCGNPHCRCARGEKHGPYTYLSRKVAGNDPRYLGNREDLVKAAEAYRQYQKILKEVVRCNRQLEGLWVKLREQRVQALSAGRKRS